MYNFFLNCSKTNIFYIRTMNTNVSVTTESIKPDDKKLLRKNLFAVFLFMILFATIFYFIGKNVVNMFAHNGGFTQYFAWGVMIFIALVALFILVSSTVSAFATTKEVKEGYITNKEIDVRAGTRTSSGSNRYYFTIGDQRDSTTINYFNKFEVGDKVRLHYAKPMKELFRVEVLEKAGSIQSTSHSAERLFELMPESSPMSVADKSALKKSIFSNFLMLFFSLFIAAFIAIAIIIGIVISIDEFKTWKPIYGQLLVFIPTILGLAIVYFLNKRLWRSIADLSKGEKIILTDSITDIFHSNRPMLNKYTTTGSFGKGNYNYASTKAGYFVGPILNADVKAGAKLKLHVAPRSKVVLDYEFL